jgi:hypothetical protein
LLPTIAETPEGNEIPVDLNDNANFALNWDDVYAFRDEISEDENASHPSKSDSGSSGNSDWIDESIHSNDSGLGEYDADVPMHRIGLTLEDLLEEKRVVEAAVHGTLIF